MMTKIQKWGNSQGLRVPKEVLNQAHISIGDDVDIGIRRGAIVIKPISRVRGKYDLRDLIAEIPASYKPKETTWGKPEGREEW